MSGDKKVEEEALVEFLEEKCEAKEVLIVVDVAKEFKDKKGVAAAVKTLTKWIRKYSNEDVPQIRDEAKRAKQLFGLSVTINDNLLKELQAHAHVVLDSNGKMVEYVANDGSLTLKGDQSHGSKMKKVHMCRVAAANNGNQDSKTHLDSDPPATKRSRVVAPGSLSRPANQTTSMTSGSNQSVGASSSSNLVGQMGGSAMPPNASVVHVPAGTLARGLNQVQPSPPPTVQLDADRKIDELKKTIETVTKEFNDINSKNRDKIAHFQKEIGKQSNQLDAFSTTLDNYRVANEELRKEKVESDQEKREMMKKMEQMEDLHKEEIKKLEKEAAEDLEKKVQERKNMVDVIAARTVYENMQTHKKSTSEMEQRHKEEIDEMKRKLDESARIQKELEDQHKKDQEERTKLQNQIEQLILNHEMFSRVMNSLNNDGATPSNSNAAVGMIEQLRTAVAEEMEEEAKSDGQEASSTEGAEDEIDGAEKSD
ncbi:hypothetical protein CAEBREN_10471 [Caenorhabditis brenneri]|uniref:SPK domain-containing protein n=1 Tax=Caenorhabditis brenneri TaxID=135651 RepID=G0P457_CAEBE|nr:hypothetical protein CAEBREN_10471 [Caenorhabditis brenneri]